MKATNIKTWLAAAVVACLYFPVGLFAASLPETAPETSPDPVPNMATHHLQSLPPGFTGIGPVVSGSIEYDQLPGKARKFLERNCNGAAVVKCEKEFASDSYNLRLADGIVMSFDSDGELVNIKAPAGYSLSPVLLKGVVPGKLYRMLINNGFQASVEKVTRNARGYRLDVSDPAFEALAYDPSGVLTLVVDK